MTKKSSLKHYFAFLLFQYSEYTNCHDYDAELGYLNTTISAKAQEEFALWKAYDDAQDSFCYINEHDPEAEYVDLLLNPERYTGYRGRSAHRVWQSIYLENCFRYRIRRGEMNYSVRFLSLQTAEGI